MSEKAALWVLAILSTPALLASVIALARGYNASVHIWREERRDDNDDAGS
jgi:hypothetical protein